VDSAILTRQINAARRTVANRYGIVLRPLACPWWECEPHALDPAWRFCVERAIDEIAWRADCDPSWVRAHIEHLPNARFLALRRARTMLRQIASDGEATCSTARY
jgi:hypothetical protein